MKSPSWPGLDIALKVNGNDLKEYQHRSVDTGDDNNVVAFVETAPDQNFVVDIRRQKTFKYGGHELSVHMFMDGVYVRGFLLNAGLKGQWGEGSLFTASDGQTMMKRFAFGSLQTSESQKTGWTSSEASTLGSIKFKVMRIRIKEDLPALKEKDFATLATKSAVPIKALKGRAMSISAKLGPAERAFPFLVSRVEYPWGREPFVTFTFLHRSLHDLKIEGVVPRTPSPIPLEDREVDDLSHDEALQLLRRQREQNERNKQLKAEIKKEMVSNRKRCLSNADDDQDEDDVTITEESNRATKRARFTNDTMNDVIDLEPQIKQEPGSSVKRPFSAVRDTDDQEMNRAVKRTRTVAADKDFINVDALPDEG